LNLRKNSILSQINLPKLKLKFLKFEFKKDKSTDENFIATALKFVF